MIVAVCLIGLKLGYIFVSVTQNPKNCVINDQKGHLIVKESKLRFYQTAKIFCHLHICCK